MTKFSVEGEGEEGPSSPNKRKRVASVFDGSEDDERKDGPTISISIDTDVLDCIICMEPLNPPVYQCDNGHIACSSCCAKLKNKCHSCSWPIGYIRCLAIEKVIESIKVTCCNARYGCKERVSYSHKLTHEETCVYAPCACPIPDCAFLGSAEQLTFHFGSDHWAASSIRFRYNCPFPVSLDKNGPFIILRGEDGRLFILNNSTEHLGNAVAVTCIGPNSSMGGFSYDLITRRGGSSLRLQSFTRSIKQLTDASASSMDFLLVPHDFHGCDEQLKLEVCIWSTREME